ncbi:MAG: hypothetical protein F6K41_27740 [Symploca sp. SIO3E6]|nr:hypothetical protein [Caldora sp. SIO3E6]
MKVRNFGQILFPFSLLPLLPPASCLLPCFLRATQRAVRRPLRMKETLPPTSYLRALEPSFLLPSALCLLPCFLKAAMEPQNTQQEAE